MQPALPIDDVRWPHPVSPHPSHGAPSTVGSSPLISSILLSMVLQCRRPSTRLLPNRLSRISRLSLLTDRRARIACCTSPPMMADWRAGIPSVFGGQQVLPCPLPSCPLPSHLVPLLARTSLGALSPRCPPHASHGQGSSIFGSIRLDLSVRPTSEDCIRPLKDAGLRIAGADCSPSAAAIAAMDFTQPPAVVVGSEGAGISPRVWVRACPA